MSDTTKRAVTHFLNDLIQREPVMDWTLMTNDERRQLVGLMMRDDPERSADIISDGWCDAECEMLGDALAETDRERRQVRYARFLHAVMTRIANGHRDLIDEALNDARLWDAWHSGQSVQEAPTVDRDTGIRCYGEI